MTNEPAHRTVLFGLGALAVVFADGAALAGRLSGGEIVSCRTVLSTVAEPPDWRSWPPLPALGGYQLASRRGGCVGHGALCGLVDTELRDDGLCPRSGVSLDGWFTGSIYQYESDILLRGRDGLFVAAGHTTTYPPPPPSKETFLVAFRRQETLPRLTFARRSSFLVVPALTTPLLALLAGLARSAKLRSRKRRYLDATLYREGERDADGCLTFADGTPAACAPPASNPGPVLVRLASVPAGSYRSSQRVEVEVVLDGGRAELADALENDARRARWRGLRVALVAGALLVLGAMVAEMLEDLGRMT
jgi:hypothetical protein